jgi:molybdopterin-binding protein
MPPDDFEHPEFPTSKVTKLVERAVNCEVTLEIAPKTYAQTIAEQD